MSSFDPVRRSPAHQLHAGLGATIARRADWEVPASYGSVDDERRAIAGGLAVADVSARGKVDCRGDVESALASLIPPGSTPPGLAEVAGENTADRVVVARLSSDRALVLGGPENVLFALGDADSKLEATLGEAGSRVMFTDATSLLAGFVLAGPRRFDLLSRLTSFDPGLLWGGTCAATRFADITAQLVRSGVGPDAVEVYVGSEYGRYAWETLMTAGASLDVRAVGWDALEVEGWW